MASLLEVQGETAGQVEVYYTEAMPRSDEGPFLKEERKLLDAIAERLGHFVSRRRLQRVLAVDGGPGDGRTRSGGSCSTSCGRPTGRCSRASAAR